MIEDQVAPKRCGHVRGKSVVGREEAYSRVRAACDARYRRIDNLPSLPSRMADDSSIYLQQCFTEPADMSSMPLGFS